MTHTAMGHNRPPISKSYFTGAIETWCKTREVAGALSQEEIRTLHPGDRLDALRKAQVLGLSKYYKDNPKADAAPGVLAIICMMADNNKDGASTISHTRIGQALHRNRENIARAATRLEKCGALTRITRRGESSFSVPVVPPEFVCQNHIVWMMDALAPIVRSIPPCDDDVTPTCDGNSTRGASVDVTPHVTIMAQGDGGGCDVKASGHVSVTAHNFPIDLPKARKEDPSPPIHHTQTSREQGGDEDSKSNMFAKVATVAGGLMTAAMSPFAAAASEPPFPPHVQSVSNWASAINPDARQAHAQVRFDAAGAIQVAGEFERELLGIIGEGQNLRAELNKAAEWVGPNTPPLLLMSKVRGRIQKMADDRRDQDRRYQAGIAARTASVPSCGARDEQMPADAKPGGEWIRADGSVRSAEARAEYRRLRGII